MEQQAAQATNPSNTGASNATDFQPTTQNPQMAPVNLQQQQSGVQGTTGQETLNQPNAQISVPVNPLNEPALAEPAQPSSGGGVVIIAFMAALVVLFLAHKFRTRRTAKKQITPAAEKAEEQVVEDSTKKPKTPTPPKKNKQTKKKKRKHR